MTMYKYQEGSKDLFANEMDEVENESFRDTMIKFHASSIAHVLKAYIGKDGKNYQPFNDDIYNAALKIADLSYDDFVKESFDRCFERIFKDELSKKEQIRLLKGVEITVSQLASIFNFAEKCGYKFSHYSWSGEPSKMEHEKLPSFMHLKDDGSVEYIGDTTLTEGQMRMLIDQADVLIARFFDNGIHWHCFLQTFKGLKGKESGVQGSRPHLHYLSDSFGISQDNLIKMIRMGRYPKTPVHIPLLNDNSTKE